MNPNPPPEFTADTLAAEQRCIVGGILSGIGLSVAVLAALWWSPIGLAPRDMADRLAFALRCDLFILIWLLAMAGKIAMGR